MHQLRARVTGNPDVWFPVLLLVAGVLFFADPLFSSKNFYFRDILNFHYPLRKVLIDSYARGEFPLWNPYVYLGQPMLANPNYMAFYPTNLFHLIMPFNYAFKLHFIVHPLLGGLGIYFLQRRLGIEALAALGGSLVYEFSGTVLSFLNLYNIVPVVALMPWLGWCFLVALGASSWKGCLPFGMVLSIQAFAFEPMIFQCEIYFLAGLALFHLISSENRPSAARAILRALSIGGLFGLALAAVQILPTLELLPRSNRVNSYDFGIFSGWSMHPLDLANVLIPNMFGNPYTLGLNSYWGESLHNGREGYLVSFFQGSAALGVVFLSFLSSRRRLKFLLVSLIVVSVFLAIGKYNPLYQRLTEYVFPFRLGRYPSKLFLLGSLALALLTSLGLEVILRFGNSSFENRRRILVVAMVVLLLAGGVLATWLHWDGNPQDLEKLLRSRTDPGSAQVKDFQGIATQLLHSLRLSGVFLLICGCLILASLLWTRSSLVVGLLILVISAELTSGNLQLVPLVDKAGMSYVPEVFTFIGQKGPGEPFRVLPPDVLGKKEGLTIFSPNRSAAWLVHYYRRSGKPMHGILHGIQYSLERSVDRLNTVESDELWKACVLLPEAAAIILLKKLNSPMLLSLGEIHDPQARQLSTFDTQSDRKLNLYWIENSLPRAYFASSVQGVSSQNEALKRFVSSDFPYGDTLIVQDPSPPERIGEKGAGQVHMLSYKSSQVRCEVEARLPGYVVLLDSYYPGWRGYVDGREVDVHRANYAFRAVAVSTGKHQVEFRYFPRSFYVGLGISCMAILIGILSLRGQPMGAR